MFRILPALPALLLLSAFAPAARAQVSVDDRITSLAEHVKKKADDQAATVIEGLSQTYGTMSEEEKKKALAAVEKCLGARREDGEDKLFESVVNSFPNFGEAGEKAALRSLKSPNVEKRRGVLAHALRSIGKFKNPDDVKTLSDYLKNSEPMVVAGAADGLGEFAEQAEKVRKPIVEELVKGYATYASAASNASAPPPQKAQAREKLNTVEKPFLASLQKLTGQEFKDAPSAQKWLNDNRNKKWSDAAAGGGAAAPAKSGGG
jgi:hypothetical protein